MSSSGLAEVSDSLQDGWTPLHRACWRGKVELVSVLLAAGAALEARDQVRVRHELVWSGQRECLIVCRMDGLLSTMLL
jgi:hypothetical protein